MSDGTVMGFTGTQHGMEPLQHEALVALLGLLRPRLVLHGDCVGADAELDEVAQHQGIPIERHPPADPKKRAYTSGGGRAAPPAPYHQRNAAIVARCTVLVACPQQEDEVLRSGTWSTVRKARRAGCPVLLVLPDGRVVAE